MARAKMCSECHQSCLNKEKALAGVSDGKPFTVTMIRADQPTSTRACCKVFGFGQVKSFKIRDATCFEWQVEFEHDALFRERKGGVRSTYKRDLPETAYGREARR